MPPDAPLFRRSSPRYTIIIQEPKNETGGVPMDERNDNVMTGALLVLAGALLGAGAALLVAPQSGRATRRDIGRYARKAGRKLEGVAEDVVGSVAGMAEGVEEKAGEILEKGKDFSRESLEAVLDALSEGQARLGRQRERLAKLLG
jgi:gas vesicle protein